MALGKRVRYYRSKLGWTLEALADRSGVEVGTLSALENRDSERSKFTAQLASAFGLTIEQLLDDTRDWLEPALSHSAHQAHAKPGRYAATRWLFTPELFDALRHKKAAELLHIENIVRAHLQLPPVADAAKPARAS